MIRVLVGELALVPSDAIVRPATARLDPTAHAARHLEEVGGPEFLGRLTVQNELAVGAAVVTGAGGDLAAEFVIHAVIRSDTEPVTRQGVETAWRSALQRAREWEFARLSAPPIGTGAGNLPIEDVADIMIAVLTEHRAQGGSPAEVALVVETAEERDVFEAALRRAQAGRT